MDTDMGMHSGRSALGPDGGGRDWSDVSTSQGSPRMAGHHQKLEEAKKEAPLESSEGA